MVDNISLGYSGKLYLDAKTRTSVKNNQGTSQLFRLISHFLCGEKTSYNSRNTPTYFMLYKSQKDVVCKSPTTEANSSSQLLKTWLPIIAQSDVVSDNNDIYYTSTFSALIEQSMLKDNDGSNANNVTLALVSGDKVSILAAVEFDSVTYSMICNGGQAYAKWVVTITNAHDARNEAETIEEI